MTGTVGVATESNYCAANAFLDAFAYWRRTQGKPAVSIGLGMISEVGYLHENPKIECLLLRRGIQPLNEDEFLQIVDLAIHGSQGTAGGTTAADSLMLTGMETLSVRKLLSQGFAVTHTVMDDQRSAILSAALEAGHVDSDSSAARMDMELHDRMPWLRGLPEDVSKALMTETSATSLRDTVELVVGRRFSNLILTPPANIDYNRSFAEFGVDSMIASEFRTWFWNTFKVDIPFLDLLSSGKNLNCIIERTWTALVDISKAD